MDIFIKFVERIIKFMTPKDSFVLTGLLMMNSIMLIFAEIEETRLVLMISINVNSQIVWQENRIIISLVILIIMFIRPLKIFVMPPLSLDFLNVLMDRIKGVLKIIVI